MKKLILLFVALFMCATNPPAAQNQAAPKEKAFIAQNEISEEEYFEAAVEIIKKYETLNGLNKWPYVGYGHLVKKGENIPYRKMTEKEADQLLRKDLRENMELFRKYGKDCLLLSVLAYNVGPYRLLGTSSRATSNLVNKLKSGNRNIEKDYLSFSMYNGRQHKGLHSRRIEEFKALYRA